ncbi:MAG TPA: hypothetical protein VIG39_14715, partial [Rhizomicrobium sp.]
MRSRIWGVLLLLLAPGMAHAADKTTERPDTRVAPAQKSVTAGEFLVDAPTLINLGFEWVITGDDNRNARVAVSYRKKGDARWKPAMPLMRLQHERIYWGNKKTDDHIFNVMVPNMFAGSILDLEPGTIYEARFVLTDPDGVKGQATHIATVKTRAEPRPAAGGRVFHVYPTDWKGPKEPNSYVGLNCGYNYH